MSTSGGTTLAVQSLVPIVRRRVSGDIALANNGFVFGDVDPGGNAAARPLDVVIPGVVAGNQVLLGWNAVFQSTVAVVEWDAFTVVAGAAVNGASGGTGGVGAWIVPTNTPAWLGVTIPYTIAAGDIEAGSVRFRWKYAGNGAKNLNASAAYPLVLWGTGPF